MITKKLHSPTIAATPKTATSSPLTDKEKGIYGLSEIIDKCAIDINTNILICNLDELNQNNEVKNTYNIEYSEKRNNIRFENSQNQNYQSTTVTKLPQHINKNINSEIKIPIVINDFNFSTTEEN